MMNATAITWLGRQIAWEARLAELRRATPVACEREDMPAAA